MCVGMGFQTRLTENLSSNTSGSKNGANFLNFFMTQFVFIIS